MIIVILLFNWSSPRIGVSRGSVQNVGNYNNDRYVQIVEHTYNCSGTMVGDQNEKFSTNCHILLLYNITLRIL